MIMKKLSLFCTALCMLLLGSCAKDDTVVTNVGEVTMNVTAGIESLAAPYAGRGSADGGIVNVKDHNIRYILGIYDANGENLVATYYQILAPENAANANFNIRLLANSYKFVFWADFVTADVAAQTSGGTDASDAYYVTSDLKAITLKGDYSGNNDARDAYTAVENIDLTSSSATQAVTLKRPFGKIRIATTDIPNASNYTPNSVTVTYKNGLPNTFDAVAQAAVAGATTADGINYSYELANGSWEDAAGVGSVLAWDYLLPGEISFTIATTDGDKNTTRVIETIPVETNKLTTVKGGILTNGAKLTVTIDDAFAVPGNDVEIAVVETVNDLQEALSAGVTNITLTTEPTETSTTIELPSSYEEGAQLSLTLPELTKPFTIKEPEQSSGDGQLPDQLVVTTPKTQALTIDTPNSTVKLNGEYQTVTASTADNTLIIAEGSTVKSLTVEKGNVEIYGKVIGYTLNNDASIVKTYAVGDAATLKDAMWLAEKGKCARILLTADIDLKGSAENLWKPIDVSSQNNSFKELDGAGHTISNLYVDNHKILAPGEKEGAANYYGGLFYVLRGTVKNLTIDGATVICNRGAALVGRMDYGTVENCHVKNVTVKGWQKVGGLIGFVNASVNGDLTVRGSSVEGCHLSSTYPDEGLYQAGGLIGYLQTFDRNVLIEGNSVSGISFDKVYESAADVADKVYDMEQAYSHAFIGTIANCSKDKDAYDKFTIELRNNTVDQVSGIPTCDRTNEYIGWWAGDYNMGRSYSPKLVVDGQAMDRLVEIKRLAAQIAAGGEVTIRRNYDLSALDGAIQITKPTTITINADVVLSSGNESNQLINKSELTIKAGDKAQVNFARRVVENLGTLTVEGGTYTTKTIGSGTLFWNNAPEAVMTLKNVNTVASNFAVAGGGQINIEGGHIRSTATNLNGPYTWAYCVRAQDGGEMTIKNATIEGVQGAIACNGGSHILIENSKAWAKNTPNQTKDDAFYALYAAQEGIIEVISGEFYSDRTPCCLASDEDQPGTPNGGFILKGGKYSSKPQTNLPKPGYTDWSPAEGYKYQEITEPIDGLSYSLEIVAE